MQFKGNVRWSEAEEQALYCEAEKCLNNRYQEYSHKVRRLRRSWMTFDHLIANVTEEAGWNSPPVQEPFFGRIDLSFDSAVAESRYIGYSGIDVADTRILDWRTPLAGVYYSGTSVGEKVSYEAPRGIVWVRMTLRRRFKNTAQIVSTEYEPLPFYGDMQIDSEQLYSEYLESMLARHTDGLMRDIVRTIDAEQNEAIRTDVPFIMVIGGPGTGKTSVALHRIAYLNYKQQYENRGRKRISHFAYVSPTGRLCAYTSGVFRNIPDAFPEYWSIDTFLNALIQAHCKHFSSCRNLEMENRLDFEQRVQKESYSFKYSMQKLHASASLDQLIYLLKLSAIGEVRKVAEKIGREKFIDLLRTTKRAQRHLDFLKKQLTLREDQQGVKLCIKAIEQCNAYLKNIIQFIEKILSIIEGFHYSFDLTEIESCHLLLERKLFSKFVKALNNLRRRYPFWDVLHEDISYLDQISNYLPSLREVLNVLEPVQLFRKAWNDSQVRAFVQREVGSDTLPYLQILTSRPTKELFYDEKLLLCLFLTYLFISKDTVIGKYSAIAIDEVQNIPYSLLLCIYRLTHRLAPGRYNFILMQDPEQKTSLIGSEHSQVSELFNAAEYRLTRVYRNNPHILNAARALLNTQSPILLVRREGLKPEVRELFDEEIAKHAQHLIDTYGYTNVAIITKILDDAESLGGRLNLPAVNEDKPEILKGAFIIPLSLCVGLEFDAVIVWNAADEQYAPDSPEDKRKLYVASTRAMHHLIFHKYPATASTLVDVLVSKCLVQRA